MTKMVLESREQLQHDLARSICERTGRRVRDLAIEMCPEGVVLHGYAVSYHVKQLAQQCVRELMPEVELRNAIIVGN
jgi:hypothetical protein